METWHVYDGEVHVLNVYRICFYDRENTPVWMYESLDGSMRGDLDRDHGGYLQRLYKAAGIIDLDVRTAVM